MLLLVKTVAMLNCKGPDPAVWSEYSWQSSSRNIFMRNYFLVEFEFLEVSNVMGVNYW